MSAEQESQLPQTIAKALILRRKGQQFTNPDDSVKARRILVSALTEKGFRDRQSRMKPAPGFPLVPRDTVPPRRTVLSTLERRF